MSRSIKESEVQPQFSLTNRMSYFHPLEAVARGSETQLQVVENSNC